MTELDRQKVLNTQTLYDFFPKDTIICSLVQSKEALTPR